jgi:hypothetical protein
VKNFHVGNAFLVFFILHLLVYPASNGYNSYMDRDTGPIGGIKNPLQPTRQLFYTTVLLDITAVLLSFLTRVQLPGHPAEKISRSRLPDSNDLPGRVYLHHHLPCP